MIQAPGRGRCRQVRWESKNRRKCRHIVPKQTLCSLRLAGQQEADSKVLRTATERQSLRRMHLKPSMSSDPPNRRHSADAQCWQHMIAANCLSSCSHEPRKHLFQWILAIVRSAHETGQQLLLEFPHHSKENEPASAGEGMLEGMQ